MHRFVRCGSTVEIRKSVPIIKRFFVSNPNKNLLSFDDIPRPKSLPLFGTKLEFIASGSGAKLHEYAHKRHRALGPIYCEKLGTTDIVFISDPQLMKILFQRLEGKYPVHILPDPWILYQQLYGYKRGLFFMDGEEWLHFRRIMNKLLLREGTESWIENPIKNVVENFAEKWTMKAKLENTGIRPNIESELYRLSIDVIINVLMGSEAANVSKHHDELIQMFSEEVKKIFQTTTKLYSLPLHWCHRLNLKPWREFKECVDASLFLAQKLVAEILATKSAKDGLISKLEDEKIVQEDLTRIVADFIIAAGDTTAFTLLWTLYLLSRNKEVIKEIRAKDNNYSKYVLKESMRLYPVAPFLTRILQTDSVLGDFKIPAGTPIVCSIYTSGRDENNFSKPELFLPYRWDRNDTRRIELKHFEASATMPFAMGTRSCIGKKIAIVQLSEYIKQIVDKFDITYTNKTNINAVTSQVLVPDKPLNFVVTLRDM